MSRVFSAVVIITLIGVLASLAGCGARSYVASIDSFENAGSTPHYDYALAELSVEYSLVDALAEGRAAEKSNRPEAADLYLEAARQIHEAILAAESPEDRWVLTRELYNRAVASWVRTASPEQVRSVVYAGSDVTWGQDYFEELIPASDLRVSGIRTHHHEPGVGAPLVGINANLAEDHPELCHPDGGIARPVTAVLHFEDGKPSFALYDPRKTRSVMFAGREESLATDFTAPLATSVDRTDLTVQWWPGLTDAEDSAERLGVYLLEPYDPDKTPVLLIHGLLASPLVWVDMTNELQADPELRDDYQVWVYFYPTGPSLLYTGYLLQERLDALRAALDPDNNDPAMQDMILVGHSMGGLVARTLTTDSGTRVWDRHFTIPPSEVQGDTHHRGCALDVLQFERQDYVSRVVFISTPHRGANMANSPIGWVGNSGVDLPDDVVELVRGTAEANRDNLKPGPGTRMLRGPMTSIEELQPGSVVSTVVGTLPIHPEVRAHSIIASVGPGNASDGVVPYWSSHIDDAESELIIASDHNAMDNTAAINEVRRILHVHRGER